MDELLDFMYNFHLKGRNFCLQKVGDYNSFTLKKKLKGEEDLYFHGKLSEIVSTLDCYFEKDGSLKKTKLPKPVDPIHKEMVKDLEAAAELDIMDEL